MDTKFYFRPLQFDMSISLGEVHQAIEFMSLVFKREDRTRDIILKVISM